MTVVLFVVSLVLLMRSEVLLEYGMLLTAGYTNNNSLIHLIAYDDPGTSLLVSSFSHFTLSLISVSQLQRKYQARVRV